MRDDHHRFDIPIGEHRYFQRFERYSGCRAGGNLERVQTRALDNLQQAKERGRLDRDWVANYPWSSENAKQDRQFTVGDRFVAGRSHHLRHDAGPRCDDDRCTYDPEGARSVTCRDVGDPDHLFLDVRIGTGPRRKIGRASWIKEGPFRNERSLVFDDDRDALRRGF
jgi:hypothetical protein